MVNLLLYLNRLECPIASSKCRVLSFCLSEELKRMVKTTDEYGPVKDRVKGAAQQNGHGKYQQNNTLLLHGSSLSLSHRHTCMQSEYNE